ncbi:T9SS type A sorting domain-containing protein, partial [Apibacter muscae]
NLFVGFSGKIHLPEELEEIQNYVFAYSTIKELSLSKSLKTIGVGAFSDMKQLEKLSICAITPPTLGANAFSGVPVTNVELSIPDISISQYKEAPQWKEFTNITESNCGGLSSLSREEIARGPNTYIFDIDKAKNENLGGLLIPVKKAYAAWETAPYLENKRIPEGILSTSVVWEETSGLIRETSINQLGEKSNIKVLINKNKGKGNAVIAFHVGNTGNPSIDPIYWSWHVWITDDPTKDNYTYDSAISPLNGISDSGSHNINTFMDRNLGALSNSFLGNEWNKSGGLMYQWGRKDPFPSFLYRGGSEAIVSSMFGELRAGNSRNKLNIDRPSKYIEDNISLSIQNPLKIFKVPREEHTHPITGTKRTMPNPGTSWFASNAGQLINGKAFDLWGDNKGNLASPSTMYMVQQPKSVYDPCPVGWRVPSFGSSTSQWIVSSPWGVRPDYVNTGIGGRTENFKEPLIINKYHGAKIYKSLGFDFTGMGSNNIGIIPLTGHYVDYYSYEAGPTIQDQGSEANLHSATFGPFNGEPGSALGLGLIADPSNDNLAITPLGYGGATGLGAVRCVKVVGKFDLSNSFPTVYIPSENKDFTEGLENPNSYMLVKSAQVQNISIPTAKAYSVYNQYLTDHLWPEGKLSTNVYWTTDADLIKNISLVGTDENGTINVDISPNKSGNAVISLHMGDQGNSNDPVLWSWHIWVTNDNPEVDVYTTEKRFHRSDFKDILAFDTESGLVPLTTTFLDRNLGALDADINSEDSGGFHYQWGRKDPLPSFVKTGGKNYSIYLGNTSEGKLVYKPLTAMEYDNNYSYYWSRMSMKEASEKPLHYVYNPQGANGWIEGSQAFNQDLWGHATTKSPFDPCPQGWRVPDVSGFGGPSSPWYKQGTYKYLTDAGNYWITNGVGGIPIKDGNGNILFYAESVSARKGEVISGKGVVFRSQDYTIGQIPFAGSRGFAGNRGISGVTGLWMAFMNPNNALGGAFTLGEEILNVFDQASPAVGYSVRCAKDEPRLIKETIFNPPANFTSAQNKFIPKVTNILAQTGLTESQVQVTPNPNSGIFKVMLTDIPEGMLRVFSFTGDEVYTKSFKAESEISINIQSLPAGVYVVQVQSQGQTVSKKIMKK